MYKINKRKVAFRKINGIYYVVDTKNLRLFTFNDTASLVWELLIKGYTADEITKKITEEYDVSKEEARTDVKSLLKKLQEEKIIEGEQI